jgi:hypothetical protein
VRFDQVQTLFPTRHEFLPGELTLSVNLYGSVSDRARILFFLGDIDAELPRETPSAH